MTDELEVDLRPSPWRVHRRLVIAVAIAYVVFALAIVGGAEPGLESALMTVVAVMIGGIVAGFLALVTLLVWLCARRRHPLALAYALGLGGVAVLIAAWTLAP